eukprot:Skav233679  [mRNA]  locus=scaffold1927:82773:89404:- [translate_table: standard]
MEFIVASSLKNITALDARQLASIVWSCAQLAHDQPLMPLLDALDGLLDELPTQQVGWLADSQSLPVGLHARVTERLGSAVNLLKESLAEMVPGPDGFSERSGVLQGFSEAVARVGADQLGNSGSRWLLTACGISEISPNALSPELGRLDHGNSKRLLVRASFVFDIKIHGAIEQNEPISILQGSYVAVSGTKDGIRGNRWISPVQLPVASLVDRSLCGEFQVLAKLCDEILEKTGQARRSSPGIDPAEARAAGNKAVAAQRYAAAAELYCNGLQHPDLDLLAPCPRVKEEAESLEWISVTSAAVKAAIAYAAQGCPCDVVKHSSLVAAKRAVENAKETRTSANPAVLDSTGMNSNDGTNVATLWPQSKALHWAAALSRAYLTASLPEISMQRHTAEFRNPGAIAAAVGCLRLRPAWTAAVESVRRQCDKLVHLRALLGKVGNGEALLEAEILTLTSWALDCHGPISLKDGRVHTTQKVDKGAVLLLAQPLGGLSSEAESRILEELTLRRTLHSNTLCKRLCYFCSNDVATKEVVALLRNLQTQTDSGNCQMDALDAYLLSSPRPQLLPLLGQRCEVYSCDSPVDFAVLDGIVQQHRRSITQGHCGGPSKRYGLFPALEVFDEDPVANCTLVPCGDAVAVRSSMGSSEFGTQLVTFGTFETSNRSARPIDPELSHAKVIATEELQSEQAAAQTAVEEAAKAMMTSSKDSLAAAPQLT